MNEIYEKLAAAGQLATSCGESALDFDNSARVCDIYEVWAHSDSGNVVPCVRQIDASAVPDWLHKGADSDANSGHTLLLRLVLVTIRTANTDKKIVSIASDTHGQLTKAFGLELANEFLKGTVTSVTAFPKVDVAPGAERCCYAFNHAPKLAAIWSQLRPASDGGRDEPAATEGIIYITDGVSVSDYPAQKLVETSATPGFTPGEVLRRLLQSPFCADLYASSLTPALLLAMQLGFETDLTQSRIKVAIRDIEAATGYHTFKSRVAASTHAKLSQLAVQASGSATKLASIDRKSTSLQKVLRFIVKELDKERVGQAGKAGKAQELLRHHVRVLEERLEMQMQDTRYTMKRVDIQINAIFNMMTQEDALNGIELAQSSHLIAHASYRDSSSMKTLAIVTMFFLPGSFVSAMFSMPMYEWTKADPESPSIGVGLLPQFRLYWAITLPLTTVIFSFYLWWLWYLKRQREADFDSISRKSADSSDGEEGEEVVEERRLARKRRQTTL